MKIILTVATCFAISMVGSPVTAMYKSPSVEPVGFQELGTPLIDIPTLKPLKPLKMVKLKPLKLAKYKAVAASTPTASKGSVAGNGYVPGNCTWYVKNMRPDLPNNLGNADTWYSMAQSMGLPTGIKPRVGAAAQFKGQMHVAYVTAVSGNSVTISEMNVGGLYQMNTRVVQASELLYIY